jgi:hypothetical protein
VVLISVLSDAIDLVGQRGPVIRRGRRHRRLSVVFGRDHVLSRSHRDVGRRVRAKAIQIRGLTVRVTAFRAESQQ